MDEFNLNKRETLEINEILSAKDEELLNFALKIKKAIHKSYEESEKPEEDYSIFTEIERRSIEIDEINNKEHKILMSNLKHFIPEERKDRDIAQLWNNEKNNYPYYPENLVDHFKAYNNYKLQDKLIQEEFMRKNN